MGKEAGDEDNGIKVGEEDNGGVAPDDGQMLQRQARGQLETKMTIAGNSRKGLIWRHRARGLPDPTMQSPRMREGRSGDDGAWWLRLVAAMM